MLAALIVFLAIGILGDIFNILRVGSSRDNTEGVRLLAILWYIITITWAVFLMVMFVGK